MKLSIRTKLIGNLILAAALPLAVAVITLLTAGYRQQVNERATAYTSEARHLAQNLALMVEPPATALADLLTLTDLAGRLTPPDTAPSHQIQALDERWPDLAPDSPEVQRVLHNEIADQLRQFQQLHPVFAEILLTDAAGRLIAATDKTSDYYQADEPWWQRAVALAPGETWIEGLELDESANVLSLDVCMPIGQPHHHDDAPAVGVVKAVLDVSPLFDSVPLLLSVPGTIREVVRDDGRVMLRLMDQKFAPSTTTLQPDAWRELTATQTGWAVIKLKGIRPEMVGIAPLPLFGVFRGYTAPSGPPTLFVVVRQDANTVLAPVRRQLIIIAALGSLIGAGSVGLGVRLSGRHFVEPLKVLRDAAQAMAAAARAHGPLSRRPAGGSNGRGPLEMVRRVRSIQTGDELEAFGSDFAHMAEELMRYQGQLETDVATAHLQLHQAQRMKAIGTLALGVAHEVKNPLQILLLGISDLSSELKDAPGDLPQTLSEMREAVGRANRIVGSLLDFSRLAKLDLQPASLEQVLNEALQSQHLSLMQTRVQVLTVYERDLPQVLLDKQKMERAFSTVISNAIDAMPHGGRLTIRTRTRTCQPADLSSGLGDPSMWTTGDRLVIVDIEDTGEGIPAPVLPRVFEPFFTTKPVGQGAGLGLSAAQNILALHGGTIQLENRTAHGVRVTIKLKAHTAAVESPAAKRVLERVQ